MALTQLTKPRARWTTFKLKVANAVSRSLYDKLLERGISVKDFGAKGDGVTDDTNAIQDAINFCYNWLASDGNDPHEVKSCVHFPIGKYKVTRTILLSPGVSLIGVPRRSSFKELPTIPSNDGKYCGSQIVPVFSNRESYVFDSAPYDDAGNRITDIHRRFTNSDIDNNNVFTGGGAILIKNLSIYQPWEGGIDTKVFGAIRLVGVGSLIEDCYIGQTLTGICITGWDNSINRVMIQPFNMGIAFLDGTTNYVDKVYINHIGDDINNPKFESITPNWLPSQDDGVFDEDHTNLKTGILVDGTRSSGRVVLDEVIIEKPNAGLTINNATVSVKNLHLEGARKVQFLLKGSRADFISGYTWLSSAHAWKHIARADLGYYTFRDYNFGRSLYFPYITEGTAIDLLGDCKTDSPQGFFQHTKFTKRVDGLPSIYYEKMERQPKQVIYVNKSTKTSGSDDRYGVDIDSRLATVQEAFSRWDGKRKVDIRIENDSNAHPADEILTYRIDINSSDVYLYCRYPDMRLTLRGHGFNLTNTALRIDGLNLNSDEVFKLNGTCQVDLEGSSTLVANTSGKGLFSTQTGKTAELTFNKRDTSSTGGSGDLTGEGQMTLIFMDESSSPTGGLNKLHADTHKVATTWGSIS